MDLGKQRREGRAIQRHRGGNVCGISGEEGTEMGMYVAYLGKKALNSLESNLF